MSTYILTSMFPNGFDDKASEIFRRKIDKSKRNKFAFVASEFEKTYEKNDSYFTFFLRKRASVLKKLMSLTEECHPNRHRMQLPMQMWFGCPVGIRRRSSDIFRNTGWKRS